MNRIEEAALSLRDGHAVEENAAILWEYLEPKIRNFFLQRRLSPDSSGELTQEVFMRLFRSIGSFRFEASIERWAFTIAANIWRNTLQASSVLSKQGQQVSLQDVVGQDGKPYSSVPNELMVASDDPLSKAVSRERRILLQESISKLPPLMRRCVELRYGRELETREIAIILEIPQSTVRSSLSKARRRLAAILQGFCGELSEEELPGEESIAIGPSIKREFSPIVAELIQICDAELMDWLGRHPEDLYRVHPGTFERIVAEIFNSEGFQVESVSSWNQSDGGVDLIAVKKVAGGMDIRLAVQCKRFSHERRVSAEPIRSLAGVLDRFRVHTGVIATTSYFTEAAQEEAGRYFWRISLRDYDSILNSLRASSGFELQPTGLWLPRGAEG